MFTGIACAQTSLDTAVNFTVKDTKGITHHLNDYLEQGKIVVIDFFTITCGPCITYAPLINESYTHFGCNSSNVVFLGINWGGDNAGVQNFGESYGVFYPEVSGTEGNGNHVVADYGVLSYPTVILILPDALIAEKYIWPPTTEHLDSLIVTHGGIMSVCTTPIQELNRTSGANKITSLSNAASGFLSCLTSVTETSSIQLFSLAGFPATGIITIQPGETKLISTCTMKPGYYQVILRNNRGMILDHKPVIISRL